VGAGFDFGKLEKITFDSTLRNSKGQDVNVCVNVRLSDIVKYSDFVGGFSAKQKTGDWFYAYLPIGKLWLMDTDALEVCVTFPTESVLSYDVVVSACDLSRQSESVKGYESLKGTGLELALKDVSHVYLMEAVDGSSYPVKDDEVSDFRIDKRGYALANAIGRMEVREDISVIYEDTSKFSQNVSITVPEGKKVFVVKSMYLLERMAHVAAQSALQRNLLTQKIKVNNPEKYRYLEAVGLITPTPAA
jgi:hypothetical protein